MILRLAVLTTVLCAAPAWSATISWDCNTESDMKEYRLERSGDAGASWGVASMIPHPQPCVSPITLQYGAYLAPGTKLFRLFAGDKAGNWSQPSNVVSLTVKPPIIGNTGGQVEQPLPPSPFVPVVNPPPVVRPGKLAGFQVSNIGSTSAKVTVPLPAGTGADIRLSLDPIAWGGATSLSCASAGGVLTCLLENLLPNRVYALQGVYYFGVMNQGAIYGDLSDVVTFTTAPFVPSPTSPPPPDEPDDAVTVADALDTAAMRCKQAKSCSGKTFANFLLEELKKVKP
ncbi:MAG: hypothetical protein HRU82_02530 [Nitrospira sp.]|nr:MAG: hypothetical protein HRU82_02530 [Nitrospira sp.]